MKKPMFVALSLLLCGCTVHPIPMNHQAWQQKQMFETINMLQQPQDGADPDTDPVALKHIDTLKKEGYLDIFQVWLIGLNLPEKANFLLKVQNPLTAEWHTMEEADLADKQAHRYCIPIAQKGKNQLVRYLFETSLPDGGQCSLEVAQKGAVLKIDPEKPFAKDEILGIALYFDQAHQKLPQAKQSKWRLEYTQGDPKIAAIDRADKHQIWIRVADKKLEFTSGLKLSEVAAKEKPDLVLNDIHKVLIQRLDPHSPKPQPG